MTTAKNRQKNLLGQSCALSCGLAGATAGLTPVQALKQPASHTLVRARGLVLASKDSGKAANPSVLGYVNLQSIGPLGQARQKFNFSGHRHKETSAGADVNR